MSQLPVGMVKRKAGILDVCILTMFILYFLGGGTRTPFSFTTYRICVICNKRDLPGISLFSTTPGAGNQRNFSFAVRLGRQQPTCPLSVYHLQAKLH